MRVCKHLGSFYSLRQRYYDYFLFQSEVGIGTTRKTITETGQQDAWIKAQTEVGDLTHDSESIRDLIRRDQTCQAQLEAIRIALIKGEESAA